MSSEELNETVDESLDSGSFDLDPELFEDLDLDAISEGDEKETSDDGDNSAQENKTEEQVETKKENGKLSLADLKGKSWEELSSIKEKIPEEFMETFKSMERAVQMKMQSVAEERKETKRLQDELEQLKRQMQEEPPYIKAERERQRQRDEQERLENMTPDERREYELENKNKQLESTVTELKRALETERFMAMKSEVMNEIRDELLDQSLPSKDAKIVYNIWAENAVRNQDFTIADAVQMHKAEKTKPKAMTEADINAMVQAQLKKKIEELKSKSKGATGIKGNSPASGKNLSNTQKNEPKKYNSAEDIFGDLADYFPDD